MDMDEPKLTDEEALAMLKRLTRHFNEPVKPLSKFCTAMRAWFEAVRHNNEDPTMLETQHGQTEPEYQFGSAYFKQLGHINTDIAKSYLLARLMYEDEPLRTEKCPVHKGHWDGQTQLRYGCTYGCDGSGWLKTPEMVQAHLERFRKHSKMTDAEVVSKGEANDILTKEQRKAGFEYEEQRYFFEWLYHLGRIDLVPEGERG
jgi:hypothetical protein